MARKLDEIREMRKALSAEEDAEFVEEILHEVLDAKDEDHIVPTSEQLAEWERRAALPDDQWLTWEQVEREVFSPEARAMADRL